MQSRWILGSAALLLLSACREPKPWSMPSWRPAEPPTRIVAASIFAAEVLLAIGRDRLAGVHTIAADPEYSLVAADVGDLPLVGAEAEQLLHVRPDLVLTDAFTRAETQALLDAAGVPIVRMADPASFADVAANIRRLGRVCHLEQETERLVQDMLRRLRELEQRGGEVARWQLCNLDGALHSHGRGSLFDAVIRAAGAVNVAAERGVGSFRKLDAEEVLVWRPDALVLAGALATAPQQEEWLRQHPGLRVLPCVQRQRLLFVPAALLGTTSHRLVDTVAFVQQALLAWGHP